MALNPKLPPGRANRKALQFATDIQRLRQAGYPFSAIQAALIDAGVRVSLTTIKREAARRDAPALSAPQLAMPRRTPNTEVSTTAGPVTRTPRPLLLPTATGREHAEAFFNAHPSNPLLRNLETP